MPPHVIKKYANRRLYDAAASRHVTLEDLRKLIVTGETIQVIDDRSGEDLTRQILLQIIAEQEQFGRPILTVPVLEAVIRFYGNAMQEFMAQHLERSIEAFLQQQAAAQAQLARLMSASPLDSIGELTRQNLEAWTRMQESLLGTLAPGAARAPSPEREAGSAPPADPGSRPAASTRGGGRRSGRAKGRRRRAPKP